MDLILGDEFVLGYNGHKASKTYVSQLEHATKNGSVVKGHVGAAISRGRNIDLTTQVKSNPLINYQSLILAYGANDYAVSHNNLSIIAQDLTRSIIYAHHVNPQMKIYGILPLNRYRHGKSCSQITGPGLYTLKELINLLALTYNKSGVPCLNWDLVYPPVLTNLNFKRKLTDQQTYPTPKTYQQIINDIHKFIKAN